MTLNDKAFYGCIKRGGIVDLSILKPIILAEVEKLVDNVLFPEIEKFIKDKVDNQIVEDLLLQLVPVLKAAADAELKKLGET